MGWTLIHNFMHIMFYGKQNYWHVNMCKIYFRRNRYKLPLLSLQLHSFPKGIKRWLKKNRCQNYLLISNMHAHKDKLKE